MKNKKIIKNLIQKIEKSFIIKIMTCFILSFIVIVIFFIASSVISKKERRKYTITSDDKLINQIENVSIEDNRINISGYAFLLDMDSYDTVISILLKSVDSGKEVWANVEQTSRSDVASFFTLNNNYENSGFNGRIKEKRIDENECYEILIKLDYIAIDKENIKVNKTVSTNRFIFNKELYSYNPYEFEQPDIESELISEVFSNGQLSFYLEKEGLYVYQYNNQLYWITNEKFHFAEDIVTTISCNVFTSYVDKLPQSRIKYKFDTLGFVFEENEYTNENISPYRVAIYDIPSGYPIKYITSGVYDLTDNDWVWNKSFNINYLFN